MLGLFPELIFPFTSSLMVDWLSCLWLRLSATALSVCPMCAGASCHMSMVMPNGHVYSMSSTRTVQSASINESVEVVDLLWYFRAADLAFKTFLSSLTENNQHKENH